MERDYARNQCQVVSVSNDYSVSNMLLLSKKSGVNHKLYY